MVEVRTPVGTVAAHWVADQRPVPGAHHVEWELDEEFRWGLNCSRAEVGEPRLCQNERRIYSRGRLGLEATASVPAFAYLELVDAVIALGHIDALPEGAAGSWIELRLEPENVEVYPYLL